LGFAGFLAACGRTGGYRVAEKRLFVVGVDVIIVTRCAGNDFFAGQAEKLLVSCG
jgi:hypothetical protein